MRELSLFVDESGDFGPTSQHGPYYLVAFVIHEQDKSIDEQVERFNQNIVDHGMAEYMPVHTAPLIRREGRYRELDGKKRKELFDILFAFVRRCDITHKVIIVDKRLFGSGNELKVRIARELRAFVRSSLDFFQGYDRIIVYYDRGQKQLSSTLEEVLGEDLGGIEFRTVDPADYLLFQTADLSCTMELVELRRLERGLTKSESAFFGGASKFKKTYLRAFRRQDF